MNNAVRNWASPSLGEFVHVTHGWAFKGEHFSEALTGRPIVVNIGNFDYSGGFRFESTTVKEYRGAYPPEFELEPGDILLVMTCQTPGGEILGLAGQIPDDGRIYLHNQRLGKMVVRDESSVDRDWLYYLCLSPAFNRHLTTTASGTKILHTSPSRIESFPVDLPPLAEQQAIGTALRVLDDKIELNRRMNQTLEAMAAALFKAWFVDFEPVRANAQSRPLALGPEVSALFPSSFDQCQIAEVPRGWQVGSLGTVMTGCRRAVDPSELDPDTPYIGLEHMPRKSIALGEWGTAAEVNSAKLSFHAGEILFGKLRPYFHKVGVAVVDGVASSDIVVISTEPDWYGFVLGHVSSGRFVDHTNAASSGTKMPRVSWADMEKYSVLLPPVAVAAAYSRLTRPLVARIRHNVMESRSLATLRDTLLPKLLSGELCVREAESLVGAVV